MRRYSMVLIEHYEKARDHGRWHDGRPNPLQFNQPITFHHPKGTRKARNPAPAVLGQLGEGSGLKFAQQSQQLAVLIAQYCGQGRQGGEGYRPLRNLQWCRSVLSFSADDTTSEGTLDWRTARVGIGHRCEIALGPIDHVWPSTRWIEQTAHGWRKRSLCLLPVSSRRTGPTITLASPVRGRRGPEPAGRLASLSLERTTQ